MAWIETITLLSVLQLFAFGGLVARARARYGVKAPAITGHEMFERYYRVQVNTIETLMVFLPALWIAGKYWSPVWASLLGVVYLIGRVIYLQGYVADPAKRSAGYAISILPTLGLILASVIGLIRFFLTGE